MTKSPCIGCEFELADKNNPTCRECDRRVEYVASIEEGEGIMEEIEKTEVRDQRSEIGSEEKGKEQGASNMPVQVCIVEGCQKKIAARDFCSTHFSAWQDGRIKHPILGKYFKVRNQKMTKKNKAARVKKTAPVKKIKSPKSIPGELEYTRLDGGLIIDLENYPRIKHQIDFLADKYLVNSEHVVIGLLGEALAGRRERSDHE